MNCCLVDSENDFDGGADDDDDDSDDVEDNKRNMVKKIHCATMCHHDMVMPMLMLAAAGDEDNAGST